MQELRRVPRISARRAVVFAVAGSLLFLGLEVSTALELRQHHDRRQFVASVRLAGALQTFRPSERAGLPKPVEAADLSPERSVRTMPSRCAPLTLLSSGTPLDGQSWTGISGSPAQPVNTLTVRYVDASAARAELSAKRMALLRCRTLQLVFPPFDDPAEPFTVHPQHWLLTAAGDRVTYRLDGPKQSYGF